jgi:hypothetical protein
VANLFGNDETPQSKGGKARASSLSPEARRDIAKRAASARWDLDGVLRATHGSSERPLKIGNIEIPCYVLEDGTRVLSQRGVVGGLGMKYGTRAGGADRLTNFLKGRSISPFVPNELVALIESPIRFRHSGGGNLAYGYPATILADICDAVLAARKADALQKQQEHIAERCEILVRGFARVGIIALVDEATGYQEVRDRKALEEILNRYLSEELKKWTKTFPDDYFSQIFRLKGWKIPNLPTARPGVMALYTKDIVYLRLAPGVLQELEIRNPTDGHGRRKHKHFQHLSDDYGHPKLREHLNDVVLLMKASLTWAEFRKLLERAKPRISAPGELPFNPPSDG